MGKNPTTAFHQRKTLILKGLTRPDLCDNSPKGSVDTEALPIMTLLNEHPNYITTSSCSGRIAIFAESPTITEAIVGDEDDCKLFLKGWLFVSHQPLPTPFCLYEYLQTIHSFASFSDATTAANNTDNGANKLDDYGGNIKTQMISLKFEPFVLHVEAASLETGRMLLQMATHAGFRNSGMSVGKDGRVIVAIRSTLKLDLPVALVSLSGGRLRKELLVPKSYLDHVHQIVNQKFVHNTRMIEKLFAALRQL